MLLTAVGSVESGSDGGRTRLSGDGSRGEAVFGAAAVVVTGAERRADGRSAVVLSTSFVGADGLATVIVVTSLDRVVVVVEF